MLSVVVTVGAQSFGRNKVHYDDFNFRILETPHFDLYYYPAEHAAAIEAGRLAERWYARLSHALDHSFKSRIPIILYASHAQFEQTNIVPGFVGESTGGVTEHERGRVVLPVAAGFGETDHVLGHEIVHAFQRDILRKTGRPMSTLPLWFLEGMAEYLSVGGIDANTAMWLRDAAADDHLPRIDQLNDPRWFPYRYGQALWAYLAGRFGDDVVAKCLKSKAPGGAVGRLMKVTGLSPGTLSSGWHESIRQLAAAAEAGRVDAQPKAIISRANGGRLNVGPSLSPDGKSVVFLSERDQYSIDVFLADAATGAIRRKIIQTASDPHFDSLQFIESAGAWDPTGRLFALAARSGGQPVISIVDMRTGSLEREIPVHEVDQVFSPTWSPDSRRIAFSALKGGLSDLYVLDLDSGSVRALTHDAFADLQPSWSPDGRTIAFSTDRFSSSLESLTFGYFRLGAIDVESGAARELPSVAGAKNIDPHWSADGTSVYFVADGGRISNIYRLAVADGELFQITTVTTGVSGITALSPALSVASAANRLAYSVYRHGAYEIHAIDAGTGTPVEAELPQSSSSGAVAAPDTGNADDEPSAANTVRPPTFGVPNADVFKTRPYRAGLQLNRMIQPYLSAGGGSTGGFLRAGVGFSFGDMLGDQQLQTALQVGKSRDDFIAQATYLNMRSRWNWGVTGGQVPWLIGAAQAQIAVADGSGTLTRQRDVFRQLHRDVGGVAIYPFSSARRLELTGNLQSISFDRESTTSVYSAETGQLLHASTVTNPAAAPATLFETGAALVNDTSVFGPTSPVLGERYRFSAAPTFGDLSFTTVTADYRRYLMPVRPWTIALRVMHVGRYGSGADDPRLLPLAWTLRDVVRGYGDAGQGTSGLAYLTASRMLVGNVELRFPIPGAFTGRIQPGPLPVEGLIFSDVGQFWVPQEGATTPHILRSVGAGVRFNAAGFVFELDAVRPFDQLSHGWTFSFNFRPGF